MDHVPSQTSGAGKGDAPTFAALLQRMGEALHTISAALHRRGLWLVFGALGGLIGGSAVAATTEPVVNPHRYYKATVGLSIAKIAASPGTADPVAWTLQIAQLAVATDAFQEQVARQTGTSVDYVKNHVTAIPQPERAYLELTVIDTTPELTAQVAHHAGLALNDAIVKSVGQREADRTAELRQQIREYTTLANGLRAAIPNASDADRPSLQQKLSELEGQIGFTQDQVDRVNAGIPEFTITSAPTPVRINSKAYYLRWLLAREDVGAARIRANAQLIAAGLRDDSNTEQALKILRNENELRPVEDVPALHHIGLGLFAGLVLGLSSVMLGEAWDERVHDTDHAVRATGFKLLTEIPRLSRRSVHTLLGTRGRSESGRTSQAESRYLEAATILGHQIGLSTATTERARAEAGSLDAPMVLVTSATPSEGKSISAAALGAAFAQLGFRVLAVDGDYHRHSLHTYLRPFPNFVDPKSPCETRVDGVWLLGDLSPMRRKRSGTATVAELLRRIEALRGEFDVIVLDTPPILITTDASDFLHHADAVAMVVRIDQTLTPSCERAGTLVRHRDVPVNGVIVTDVPLKMIDRNYGPGG